MERSKDLKKVEITNDCGEDQEKFSGDVAVVDGSQGTTQLVTATRTGTRTRTGSKTENCENLGGLKNFLIS